MWAIELGSCVQEAASVTRTSNRFIGCSRPKQNLSPLQAAVRMVEGNKQSEAFEESSVVV